MIEEKSPTNGAQNVSINSLQEGGFSIQFRSIEGAEFFRASTEAVYENDSSVSKDSCREDEKPCYQDVDDDEFDSVSDEEDFDYNDEADAEALANDYEDFDYNDEADAETLDGDGDDDEDFYPEDRAADIADVAENGGESNQYGRDDGQKSCVGQDGNILISQTSIIAGEEPGVSVQKSASDETPKEHDNELRQIPSMVSASETSAQSLEVISSSLNKAFDELAKLSPTVYEQIRKVKAKELGLRQSKLDDEVESRRKFNAAQTKAYAAFPQWETDQYPFPVDGLELFEAINKQIKRFVIADEESFEAATIWIALTWLTDFATILPLLMITAPEKGCGKSVFLEVLQRLCKNPLSISNASNAAVFRAVSTYSPTLLLDEADTFMKENREQTGIINSGHTRGAAYVLRCNPETLEPEQFSTWGAKAIAGIKLEELSSTLVSRSIIIPMRKKMAEEFVENIRHVKDDVFSVLRAKLKRWCLDNAEKFSQTFPSIPQLQNRNMDNWEPLLAIARLAGGEWESRITKAALKIEAGFSDESLEIKLLKDIYDIFDTEGCNDIGTQDLIEMLCRKTESPWSTHNNGKPIGHNQLANKLRPYQIYSKKFSSGLRGYSLDSFTDTFARYIPDYINAQIQGRHGSNTV